MVRPTRSELDTLLEMRYYGLDSEGIGGFIRKELEDFVVVEVSIDGTRASPNCGDITQGVGEYTWFVVEKKGVDSITAARRIQKFFGVKRSDIGLAGLKDTSAVTYQFISVRGDFPPERIEEFNAQNKRVKIRCNIRRPFHLRPGLLFGNEFTVKVREAETGRLDSILHELRELVGVPNYVGYQRFGSIRPVTHVVGKYIIRGMFREAVEELLLRVFPHESPQAKKAREYLASTGDYKGALEIFPKSMKSERAVMAHLSKKPGDYVGALRKVSSYVRKLFVGAYQAYLFNKVLSKRIERGLSWVYATPGDIVGIFTDPKSSDYTSILLVNEVNAEKVNKLIRDGRAALLLPVFGYNTTLSHGAEGEIEREVLKEEEIDVSSFYIKSIPEASSAGTYRLAALIPFSLTLSVTGSDVVLSFTLRKGMYATTLLREFMKPVDPVLQGF